MNTMSEMVRSIVRGRNRTAADPQFIAEYAFPPGMIDRALTRCPASVTAEVLDAGMRQFFLAAAADPDLRASMPSRVVDEAWHEFITFTRAYQEFCQRAFGRFLHHQPEYLMEAAEATANQTTVLWGTWRTACLSAGLNPDLTRKAPTLFAADRAAHIDGSRMYIATCGSRDACTASDDVVCVAHELRAPAREASRSGRHARRGRGERSRAAGAGCGGDGDGGGCGVGGGGDGESGGCGSGGCGGGGCGGGGCGS
jgi:hypothetical protein